MSQFPADPSRSPAEADPFDELARLINGEPPKPQAEPASPVRQSEPSSDHDIQAELEGRAAPAAVPAPIAAESAAADPAPAPAMPVFDPAPSASVAAGAHPEGVHQVPTRGPLAQVARDAAPSDTAPMDSPLEAVFDLSALRAAFDQVPTAEVEPVPQAPISQLPSSSPAEAVPLQAEISEAVRASAPPAFVPPPLASVPDSEQAQVVEPPVGFAEPAPVEARPVEVAAPPLDPAADDMAMRIEAMFAAETPQAAEPQLPPADFEIDLESELEAALMADLASTPAPASAPQPAAAPAPVVAPAAAAAPLVAGEGTRRTRSSGGSRRAMALAAAIVMMGGGSAVAWSLMGGGDAADIPVILADAGATRVVPEDKGGAAIPNQDAALFKVDAKPHQDALRSGAEKPIEIATAPAVRPVKVKTQIRRALPPSARKVRTVVVKPDGTIVSGEEIVGAVEPRIINPAEPAIVAKAKPAVAQAESPKVEAPEIAAPKPKVELARAEPAIVDKPIVAKKAAAPKPVAEPVKVAKAKPAEKPAAKRKSDYVVQISSRRSPESARNAFAKLQKRYGGLLGDRSAEYQRTEIEGKGTFYRVRVLASSKSDARSLCGGLKRAGGSCFVTR